MKDLRTKDVLFTIFREIVFASEQGMENRLSLLRQIFKEIEDISYKSEKMPAKIDLLTSIKSELELALTVQRNLYLDTDTHFCIMLSRCQQKRIFHIDSLITAYQKAQKERESL